MTLTICGLFRFWVRVQVAQWVRWLDYLTTRTSISPIRRGFAPGFVNYKKGCTRLATASDKVYQLLAHGSLFSPGTPVSSTTKTGHHDIAQILLKVALNTKKQSKIGFKYWRMFLYCLSFSVVLLCLILYIVLPLSFLSPHFIQESGCFIVSLSDYHIIIWTSKLCRHQRQLNQQEGRQDALKL